MELNEFEEGVMKNVKELLQEFTTLHEKYKLRSELVGQQNYIDRSDFETLIQWYKINVSFLTLIQTIPGLQSYYRFEYKDLQENISDLEEIVFSLMRGGVKLIKD